MKFFLVCIIILFSLGIFSLHQLRQKQEELSDILEHQKNVISRHYQEKLSVTCCFYRQHYHDCFSAVNHSGCVLGTAKAGGVPPTVICSRARGCEAPMSMAGFFLTGFEWNCDECQESVLTSPFITYWEASRYPPTELSQEIGKSQLRKVNESDVQKDDQYMDYF